MKVFDFLFLVNEIEEKGYNGDSGETALLAHDEDIEKVTCHLKRVIIITSAHTHSHSLTWRKSTSIRKCGQKLRFTRRISKLVVVGMTQLIY